MTCFFYLKDDLWAIVVDARCVTSMRFCFDLGHFVRLVLSACAGIFGTIDELVGDSIPSCCVTLRGQKCTFSDFARDTMNCYVNGCTGQMAYIIKNIPESFGEIVWPDLARSGQTCAYIGPPSVSEFLFCILYMPFSKSSHYFCILLYQYYQ